MTYDQLAKLVICREALMKLHLEDEAEDADQSWIVMAIRYCDYEIDVQLMDIEFELGLVPDDLATEEAPVVVTEAST